MTVPADPTPGYNISDRVLRLEILVGQTTTATAANAAAIATTNTNITKLISGRPSWAVTAMLTGMGSTIGILATVLAVKL